MVSELAETIAHLNKFPDQQEMLQADPKARTRRDIAGEPRGLLYEQPFFGPDVNPANMRRLFRGLNIMKEEAERLPGKQIGAASD